MDFLSLYRLQPWTRSLLQHHPVNIILTWSRVSSEDMVSSPRLATVRAVWVSMRLISVAGVLRNITRGTHTWPDPRPEPDLRASRGSW